MNSKCCYIIPVYNNVDGLNRTIKSIRSSNTPNIDIIIFDDGSDDDLSRQFPEVSNVTFLSNRKNNGIAFALNALLDFAIKSRYDFCALIDAGDHCLPCRIQLQLAYMKKNESCVILGGAAKIIDISNTSEPEFYYPPVDQKSLARSFKRGYPFVHPTAMFRLNAEILKNHRYNIKFQSVVDYDFLYRLHNKDENSISNISELLIEYVREPNSIGVMNSRRQARASIFIRFTQFKKIDLDVILGFIQPSLLLRAINPKLFFYLSFQLKKIKLKL